MLHGDIIREVVRSRTFNLGPHHFIKPIPFVRRAGPYRVSLFNLVKRNVELTIASFPSRLFDWRFAIV
jgi:hypothetical protein